MPKTPIGSWACLFPPPLLAVMRAGWHTRTEDHDGEEVALLAQLRPPLETSSKRIPPDKSSLFPAPQSLPYAPVEGMDVPSAMPLRGREKNESLREPDSQIEEFSETYEGSSQYRGSTFPGIHREILTVSFQRLPHRCCT